MATKSRYLKDKIDYGRKCFDRGVDLGQQLVFDCFCVVLNDPDVMGKDTMGPDRLAKIATAVMKARDYFVDALTNTEESDYIQEQLDRLLKPVSGEGFQPFRERYPMAKEWDYTKRSRKKDV